MADVRIKIGVQDGYEDVITSVSYSEDTNNVSRPTSYKTTENSGKNLKSWATGSLSLADGYVGGADSFLGEQGKYNGFMFGAVSPDGQYTLTLTIDGSNIDSITVFGDRDANQFPIRAYLDGDNSNYIFSDDPQWTIIFPNKASSHTITFDLWNRPNYNACITHISIFVNELWFDKRWIKNIESLSQSTGQPKQIYYGVVASSGSAEIIDRNGEIYDLVNDGILSNSNLPIEIYANGKLVHSQITTDSDYTTDKIFSLYFEDKLSKWEDILFSGRRLTDEVSLYVVLSDILKTINYSQPQIDEMLDTEIIYGNINTLGLVKDYLQNIKIPYPYLKPSTIREAVDKVCTIAQLNVFQNDNGEIKFVSARPNTINLDNIIKIDKSKYTQKPFFNIIKENNYDSTEIEYLTNNYELKNIESASVSFVDSLSSAFFDNKLFYLAGSDYDSFLTNNKYLSPLEIGNSKLLKEKILLGDSTSSSYGSLYIYKPDADITVKAPKIGTDGIAYDDAFVIKGTVNTAKKITSVDNNYYFEEFKETKISCNSLSISRNLFDKSFEYENGEIKVIKFAITTEEGNIYNTFNINSEVNSYAVIEEDGSVSYYYIIKTIPRFLAIMSSSAPLMWDKYNLNFFIKHLTQETMTEVKKKSINSKHMYSIKSNELLQKDTKYINNSISDIISDNVINDYLGGIQTVNATIVCVDYYYSNGSLAKNWATGQIVQVGDIVRVDRDNDGNSLWNYADGTPMFWKVTGRTFRKQGVPMIDLELQEVKK